ncbi:MAG: prepilin-type N-terminal cleavage/methylation domain-containing protein [Desulfobacterales bacterium]|jgi:prepilin-type N-terminal cleavage/methylation domain-containing protein
MLNTQLAITTPRIDERGFTFLEVLIVIAIFSIGVLAVAVMQVTAINTNTSARLSGEATALAANQLEALMTLNYEHADLNPANNPHEVVEGAYTVTWIVTDSDIDGDGSNDSKTIVVTVHCANPKANDVQIQYIKPEV